MVVVSVVLYGVCVDWLNARVSSLVCLDRPVHRLILFVGSGSPEHVLAGDQ